MVDEVDSAARMLRDAGESLAVAAGYAETIERVAQLAVPRIAALCLIDIVEDGSLTRRAAQADPVLGGPELRREAPHPDVGEGAPAVLRSGRALVYGRGWFDALKRVDASLAPVLDGTLRSIAVLPLTFDRKSIGVLSLGFTRPLHDADLEFAQDFARLAAVAISNARLLEDAHRARESAEAAQGRLKFVSRAGAALARSFERDATLQRLLAGTVVDFADGAYACIVESEGQRHHERAGDPAGNDLELFALRAMRDARTRVDSQMRAVTVPLLTGGRVGGALGFARSESRSPFAIDDLTMIEEVAARVAVFVESARMYTHQRNIAETLQQAFRPRNLPDVPGLMMSAAYQPGTVDVEVGGDWYDVITLDDACVAIAIGDVMGHGIDAAAAMAELRSGLRAHVFADSGPGTCLGYIDTLLTNSGGEHDLFATGVAAIYDVSTRALTIANAGHPSPYVRHADGTLLALVQPAPLLGLDAGPRSEVTHHLAAGDIVLFFTDGVVEDRARSYDDGIVALEEALRTTSTPEEMIERALALTPASTDDRTLLALMIA